MERTTPWKEDTITCVASTSKMVTAICALILIDRGRLELGLAADLAIFDPETVGCTPLRRVYDFPAGADRLVSDATGVRAVVVNGTVIREDGADAIDLEGPMPGRVLRGGRAS